MTYLDLSTSFVACTSLREFEDRIEVYVTRNNGLDGKDQKFFRRLEKLCFRLCSPKSVRPLLKECLSLRVTNRLICDISSLGRLKFAYHTS